MARHKGTLKGKFVFKDLDWDEQNDLLRNKFGKTLKKVLKFKEVGAGTSLDTGEREVHFEKKVKGSIFVYLNATVSSISLYLTDYKDWDFHKELGEFDFIDPDLLRKIANVYQSVKMMI